MDFASGGDLKSLIEMLHRNKRYLPENDLLRFIAQLADAIHFIHSKEILHRDLKGDNVLLTDMVPGSSLPTQACSSSASSSSASSASPSFSSAESESESINKLISRLRHLKVQVADFGLSKFVDITARDLAIAKTLARRQRRGRNARESSSDDDIVDPRIAMSQRTEDTWPLNGRSDTPQINKKADVWSLGCVVLELASSSLIQPKKQKESYKSWLERHIALIPKYYSCRPSLVSLIRSMLHEEPRYRLSTEELRQKPLVAVHLPQNSTVRAPQSVPTRSKSVARIPQTPQLQRQRLLRNLTDNIMHERTSLKPQVTRKRRRFR